MTMTEAENSTLGTFEDNRWQLRFDRKITDEQWREIAMRLDMPSNVCYDDRLKSYRWDKCLKVVQAVVPGIEHVLWIGISE